MACPDQKSLLDYVLAFSPLVISGAIATVGWFQYQINRHKFRLDLYNRRFAIYEKALSYFQSYYSDKSTPDSTASAAREFIRAYRESVFLFGAESAVYKALTELKDTLRFLLQFDERFQSAPYDKDEYKAWAEIKMKKPDPSTLMEALERELLPWLDFRSVEK